MKPAREVYRVLLVEDDPVSARRLQEFIDWRGKQNGYGFDLLCWAQRLEKAVHCVEAGEPSVVLLDLTLPDCEGIDVFLRLSQAASSRLPVIVLSDLEDEETAVQVIEKGAQDYLIRSDLNAPSLQRAMRHAIQRGKVERDLARKTLQRERNLLRSVIDNVPDYIQAKDTLGRYILNNMAHVRHLNEQSPAEVLGRTVFDYFPASLAARYYADDMSVLASGEPIVGKVEPTVSNDGSERWIATTKVPIYDENRETMGIAIISRDITDAKIAQEAVEKTNLDLVRSREELVHALDELRSVQLQLIEAEKMKLVGRLAAGVAHEVKNPLAIVRMGMDYMSRHEFDDPNIPVIVHEIQEAVERADAVVRGLLDFSAPKKLQLEPADLNSIVRHALILIRGELCDHKFIVVEDLAPDLPQVRLDAMKIEQVFVNVLTNAVHAMEGGGTLTIRTFTRQITGVGENIASSGAFRLGDRLAVVEVLDTGAGIPEAAISRVFEPFFSTKPTGKGTGLGLTVTKTIIDLHGGMIEIRNRPKSGACVTITFRVNDPL